MTDPVHIAEQLTRLLSLGHPPVAVSFLPHGRNGDGAAANQHPQPAGCCFWVPAERQAISTGPADHANCSVGSYTHGFISLEAAAKAADVEALVGSGWVTEGDLAAAPTVGVKPDAILYRPLSEAHAADVILMRLTPASLMTLQGACPDLVLSAKPQCQIVALAMGGTVAVSPGCAVSRVRTGLPAGELTCAIPAARLADLLERLGSSTSADEAVAAYAAADIAGNPERTA